MEIASLKELISDDLKNEINATGYNHALLLDRMLHLNYIVEKNGSAICRNADGIFILCYYADDGELDCDGVTVDHLYQYVGKEFSSIAPVSEWNHVTLCLFPNESRLCKFKLKV